MVIHTYIHVGYHAVIASYVYTEDLYYNVYMYIYTVHMPCVRRGGY